MTPATRTRLVRPHEFVWPDPTGLLHTARADRPTTGCGITLPSLDRLGRACDHQGHPLCPSPDCFGDPS